MLKCKVFVMGAIKAGSDESAPINKWLDDENINWADIKRIDQSSCGAGHSDKYSMTTTITVWYNG